MTITYSEITLDEPTFYRLADVAPAADTLAALLDAIYGADYTTDYRDEAIPATHQWTPARYQNTGTTEAVYLTPAANVDTLDTAVLIAGAATQGSATLQTESAWGASMAHVGLAKNIGAYNAWNSAAPFTSGEWAGFNRMLPTAANVTTATIRIYVAADVLILDVWITATEHHPVVVGAIGHAYRDHEDARESDGRRYGCLTQGAGGEVSATFLQSASFLDHSTATGAPHCWVYQPGAATAIACGRTERIPWTLVAGCHLDETGEPVFPEIHLAKSTATNTQAGERIAKLRGVRVGGVLQAARTRRNGVGDDLYHVLGYDSSAAGHALIIPAAP